MEQSSHDKKDLSTEAAALAELIDQAITTGSTSVQDIATAMGVSRTAIWKWRKTGSIKKEHLARLSGVLDKPAHYFGNALFGHQETKAQSDGESRSYPVLSWVEALQWRETIKVARDDSNRLHLRCPVAASDEMFVLCIEDSSMSPRFSKGQYIWIETSGVDQRVDDGAFVVIDSGKKHAEFRAVSYEHGNAFLYALNAEFRDQPILLENTVLLGVLDFHGEISPRSKFHSL